MKTRKKPRQQLEALATCRDATGRQWQTLLEDVSDGGCKIFDPTGQLRRGEILNLFFAASGPHMAKQTWRREHRVGLEFRTPLSAQLLESLASQDWTKTGAEVPEGAKHTSALRPV